MKTKEQISFNMARVRSSGSEIERTLGKALWSAGIRYRKQYTKIVGKPDFVLVSKRIAIFCDSSFWHGRGYPGTASAFKSNKDFWEAKIQRNMARDEQVNRLLKEAGWIVLRFWDDSILNNTAGCLRTVFDAVEHGHHP